VKWWITFNEPLSFCAGYGERRAGAPGIDAHGIGDYLSAHTVLHAHARVYHLYDKVFRKKQKGIIKIMKIKNSILLINTLCTQQIVPMLRDIVVI
jgi:beta-glucosidase/6-phospho-beta-glucosidase/beta-galactosidase